MAYRQIADQTYEKPDGFARSSGTAYALPMPEDPSEQANMLPLRHSRTRESMMKVRAWGRRRWTSRVAFYFAMLIGLLWLLPILFLLVVNLMGYIIGAAAWCPSARECNAISYWSTTGSYTTAARSEKYDEDNHNLLGGLQFVAKALEVWFVYVATSFMWQLTMLLGRRSTGIPLGYVLTHLEFGDLRLIFDRLLYQTARNTRPASAGRATHTFHVRFFLIAAIFMCIVANLMGPSVAVLLIPTLNWQDGPIQPVGQFQQSESANAPSGDGAIPGCSAAALQAGLWSCAAQGYGSVMDSLATTSTNEYQQFNDTPSAQQDYMTANTAVTLEESIPFSFNISISSTVSNSSGVMWSPARQTLRGLTDDFQNLFNVVSGTTQNATILDQYTPFNSSLQLALQRYGPIMGITAFGPDGLLKITQVADDKQIRCYEDYGPHSVTKCMRTGTGWNSSTSIHNFTLGGNEGSGSMAAGTVYWSDKAVIVTDVNDPCFVNGTLPEGTNCDYDTRFTNGAASSAPDNSDRMNDTLVVEWTIPNGPTPEYAFLSEFFPGLGFATHSIDVTQIWPSLQPMQVREPPDPSQLTPVVMHPAWYLAAWNVDDGGDINLNNSRAASILLDNLEQYIASRYENNLSNSAQLIMQEQANLCASITQYATAQAASLVNYATIAPPANTDNLPALQPLLWSNVYHKVWGWGINSRTSYLGVVVCFIGVLTVLARTALMWVVQAEERSAVELMTATIQCEHQGELHAVNEADAARTRYQLLQGEGEGEETIRLRHIPRP